jgi:hypothetical protein
MDKKTNLSLLIGILLLIFSMFNFFIGFHNLDIVHNDYLFKCEYCVPIDSEVTIGNEIVNLDIMYSESLKRMINSLIIIIIGAGVIGYSLKSD